MALVQSSYILISRKIAVELVQPLTTEFRIKRHCMDVVASEFPDEAGTENQHGAVVHEIDIDLR